MSTITIPKRTEHGWLITGKTYTERQKQVKKVPFTRVRPLKEMRQLQREKVCEGCGGFISLRTISNFDCRPELLFGRTQRPVCLNDNCAVGHPFGVEAKLFKKYINFVKKHDFGDYGQGEAYKGWGKSRRYNYYYLSMNVRSLIELHRKLNREIPPTPRNEVCNE